MVIKLLPEQVSSLWQYIKYGITRTKPAMMDMTPEAIRQILENLLTGTLQCWAIVDKDEFVGFFLTSLAEDYISGSKFLNVYDLFSFKQLGHEMLIECIRAGEEFAKANKCNKITAYSDIPEIISLAKRMGFTTDCVFLIKEVA